MKFLKTILPALALVSIQVFATPVSAPPRRQGGTVITADRIEYDYKMSNILFDENVKVVDPQFTMTASRVFVTLQNTNDVRQVKALGDVKLVSGDRVASSNEALYTREDGKIVLTGNATLQRSADRLDGDIITIWIDEQRMESVPATLTLTGSTVNASGKNRNGKNKHLLP